MVRFTLIPICAALALSLVACSKKKFHVGTGSMEPTIPTGSSIVVDRSAYRKADPVRWDVVAFEPPAAVSPGGAPPGSPQTWIMRVIGLPGESVDFGGAEIVVNGTALKLPAGLKGINYVGVAEMPAPMRGSTTSIVLGTDEYFVLGDNTKHANDSRFWGAVTRDRISGKLKSP